MKHFLLAAAVMSALGGCAYNSVQQLSADTFQVAVTSAPVCGRKGAANVSQKIAAIEVIKRGRDRFLIVNAQSGSEFGGFIGGAPLARGQQSIIVKMPAETDPDYARTLSARMTLGPDWQKTVSKGRPSTC